jgi:hypothetical protein
MRDDVQIYSTSYWKKSPVLFTVIFTEILCSLECNVHRRQRLYTLQDDNGYLSLVPGDSEGCMSVTLLTREYSKELAIGVETFGIGAISTGHNLVSIATDVAAASSALQGTDILCMLKCRPKQKLVTPIAISGKKNAIINSTGTLGQYFHG